ncbi:hypothetical protein DFP72DRAFT_1049122 [Ephemerocybe angulata]|uniref:Uncharacterized protein n=1 Tax=Ephemerocybe angulata TaxID=980116 RepID=A0A8H6HLF1_9AGAR|nr:hypothetical protein DFP72DRAFT_1049122 [Tulosesus angulatus]
MDSDTSEEPDFTNLSLEDARKLKNEDVLNVYNRLIPSNLAPTQHGTFRLHGGSGEGNAACELPGLSESQEVSSNGNEPCEKSGERGGCAGREMELDGPALGSGKLGVIGAGCGNDALGCIGTGGGGGGGGPELADGLILPSLFFLGGMVIEEQKAESDDDGGSCGQSLEP